jgi:hypothetical protein
MPKLALALQDGALFAPRCSQAELDLNPWTPGESRDAIREDDLGMDQAARDAWVRNTHASRLHGSAAQ